MLALLLHEVVFGDSFRVPVVSLGGIGLLVSLLVWGVVRLWRQSDRTLRSLRAVSRHLQGLRPLLDQIRATCAKEHRGELRAMLPGLWHCGLDDDGYRRLDAVLSREPLLRRPWARFRGTLLMDQPVWFRDSRVCASEEPERYFDAEVAVADVLRDAHLPAVMTGLGLLLTFLALFLGLAQVHVDADRLVGLGGLITGISGKFLTSIVGILSATVLTLLQRRSAASVRVAYADVLDALRHVFPHMPAEALLHHISMRQAELLRHLRAMDAHGFKAWTGPEASADPMIAS